jgi:hypothetical protein
MKRSLWTALAWYALSLGVFWVSLQHGHFADPHRRWDEWDDDWDA